MHFLKRALQRVLAAQQNASYVVWSNYQFYPPSRIAYAALLGASVGENLDAITPLLEGQHRTEREELKMAKILTPGGYLEHPREFGRLLEGFERRYEPVSDWLHSTLRLDLQSEFVSPQEFEAHFDWVEVVLSVAYRNAQSDDDNAWFPLGRFGYRQRAWQHVQERILASLDEQRQKSPYATSPLFGATEARARTSLEDLGKFLRESQRYYR